MAEAEAGPGDRMLLILGVNELKIAVPALISRIGKPQKTAEVPARMLDFSRLELKAQLSQSFEKTKARVARIGVVEENYDITSSSTCLRENFFIRRPPNSIVTLRSLAEPSSSFTVPCP